MSPNSAPSISILNAFTNKDVLYNCYVSSMSFKHCSFSNESVQNKAIKSSRQTARKPSLIYQEHHIKVSWTNILTSIVHSDI